MKNYELLLINIRNKEKLLLQKFIEGNLENYETVNWFIQDFRDKFIKLKWDYKFEFRVFETDPINWIEETIFELNNIMIFINSWKDYRKPLTRKINIINSIYYDL